MESPLNLLNRLRTITNPHASGGNKNIIPTLPPTSNDIIEDLDDKIANSTTRSKASKLLNSALTELDSKIKEIQKPEKLAAIANDMSRIIERSTPVKGNNEDNRVPQIIIYAPQIVTEERFNVIDVGDA